MKESSAFAAAALEIPASFAAFSKSSAFVMYYLLFNVSLMLPHYTQLK
jgi:hypothetical protein